MNAPTWRRLIAQHGLEEDPSVLNLSFALALDGPFDRGAFEWALARMIEAYPALGHVEFGASRLLEAVDAEALAESERVRVVRGLMAREKTRPFDLDGSLLLRAVAVRLRPTQHVLILTWHHAAADAWALELFATFLSRAYSAVTRGRPAPDPPSPASDPGGHRPAGRKRLTDSLVGLTARECDPFPSGGPGPLLRWSTSFAAETVEDLRAAATARRLTPFALLCGTVAREICSRYDLASLVLGTTVLNRHSSTDFNAGEARYQGALFRVARDGPAADWAAAAAAAAERRMTYDEQIACLAEALGSPQPKEPAVFVLLDRHPLANLRLDDLEAAVLGAEDDVGRWPKPAHSPRCGRIAVFWRQAPSGATLNVFAERALAEPAERLIRDVRQALAGLSTAERTAPRPIPWHPGLVKMPAPVVDALSPVAMPGRR